MSGNFSFFSHKKNIVKHLDMAPRSRTVHCVKDTRWKAQDLARAASLPDQKKKKSLSVDGIGALHMERRRKKFSFRCTPVFHIPMHANVFYREIKNICAVIKYSPFIKRYASVAAAFFVGVFSLTMIYHSIGQDVHAERFAVHTTNKESGEGVVLGVATSAHAQAIEQHVLADVVPQESLSFDDESVAFIEWTLQNVKDLSDAAMEKEIRAIVKGHPIEEMASYIAGKDRTVAAFLVAIAKKESNWGERVPVLNGHDCYNYWGYRGKRQLMGSGGHTCFNSRQDAVDTVGERIEYLVEEAQRTTPAEMVVWKCGSSCEAHDPASVSKWISDVSMYFHQLNKKYDG